MEICECLEPVTTDCAEASIIYESLKVTEDKEGPTRMLTHVTIQTQAELYICNIILHSVSQNCIVCVREEIFFVKMSFQPIFNK